MLRAFGRGESAAALLASEPSPLVTAPPTEGPRATGGAPPAAAACPTSGPPLLDLASNDYLGLSRDPAVLAAAAAELQASGLGATASRLICGTRPVHLALEEALAAWLGRQRVLLFPSGFQANLAAVAALADRHTLVLADRLIHHSLLAGVRACGARLLRFAHNDRADLERRLVAARRERPMGRLLVLSESLFSMEGTSPPLRELAALCRRHGAALLVDEAHALGVLGPGGRGLAHGLAEVALVSGTFGKAFGSGGAFLAGEALVGDWLLQSSGAFRYTTALAPPLAAGALAALRRIQADPSATTALLERAGRWRDRIEAAGWPRPPGGGPILSLLLGDDAAALAAQQRLEQAGLLTVAIRPPTVPEGSARLRLVLRSDLPPGSLARLLEALGPPPPSAPQASGTAPAGPGARAHPSEARTTTAAPLQVIAMHGWAGAATGWEPWRQQAEARGWRWQSGDRGYGGGLPAIPAWHPQGLRVLISHSMGLHLLPPELLSAAERVVLLAGFGRFVPEGRAGRPLRTALAGMAAALGDGPDPVASAQRAQALLQEFLAEAAAPAPEDWMPPGPSERPVGPEGRSRLRRDLALLAASDDLPAGFPETVPLLLVEAGDDRIVVPEARQWLAQRLPQAERIVIAGAGHAFLGSPPLGAVLQWLERTLLR